VGNIAALAKVLSKFNPAVVYGGIDHLARAAEIERFRNDSECTVLITNPQTLGEGISLHMECHDAIYVERTYNAGMYLQSIDRIHRLGLPKDTVTNITLLQSSGTIDERVATRLESKVRNLSRFLQDDSLVEASIPDSDEMPAQELFGLNDSDLEDIFAHWNK
jgi:SNF2 family DNA or RNA helicase